MTPTKPTSSSQSIYSTPDTTQDSQKKVTFNEKNEEDDLPSLPEDGDDNDWYDDNDWIQEDDGPSNLDIINMSLEAVTHNLSEKALEDLKEEGVLSSQQVSVLSRVRNLLAGAEDAQTEEEEKMETEAKSSPASKSNDSGFADASGSSSKRELGSFLNKLLSGSLRKKKQSD